MDFLLPDEATMEKMALEYEKIKQKVKALNSEIEKANLGGFRSDNAQRDEAEQTADVSAEGNSQVPKSADSQAPENGAGDNLGTKSVPTLERKSLALPSMLLYIMFLSNCRR